MTVESCTMADAARLLKMDPRVRWLWESYVAASEAYEAKILDAVEDAPTPPELDGLRRAASLAAADLDSEVGSQVGVKLRRLRHEGAGLERPRPAPPPPAAPSTPSPSPPRATAPAPERWTLAEITKKRLETEMEHTTQEERIKLLKEHQASGLSLTEFGKKKEIPLGTLSFWRTKAREKGLSFGEKGEKPAAPKPKTPKKAKKPKAAPDPERVERIEALARKFVKWSRPSEEGEQATTPPLLDREQLVGGFVIALVRAGSVEAARDAFEEAARRLMSFGGKS